MIEAALWWMWATVIVGAVFLTAYLCIGALLDYLIRRFF